MGRADGGLEVRFRLDADDLTLLRERLLHALSLGEHASEDDLIAAALALAKRARGAHTPVYVRHQVGVLEDVAAMLRDPDWRVPRSVRDRARVVLCYFLESGDLIPDDAPLFGYLDDAIMIELLARELADELDAHRRFARAREALDAKLGEDVDPRRRERELSAKRRALRARVQERRARKGGDDARARWFRGLLRGAPAALRRAGRGRTLGASPPEPS